MRGWQELRLITDGRWQPTGQLHDKSPWQRQHGLGEPVVRQILDTNNFLRDVYLVGPLPASVHATGPEVLPVGSLGWAQFSRA